MGAMNRGLNLPSIQRIMAEFEKESATMDMKEEMMSDAVDDVMDDELEDEEEEGGQGRCSKGRPQGLEGKAQGRQGPLRDGRPEDEERGVSSSTLIQIVR